MCSLYITHKNLSVFYFTMLSPTFGKKIDHLSADLRANEPEVPGKEKKPDRNSYNQSLPGISH